MARKPTGTVVYVPAKPGEKQGHYRARVTCVDGSRPWIDLDPSPKSPQAERRARESAAHYAERFRERGVVAVPQRADSRPARLRGRNEGETVSDYFERWAKSREARVGTVKDDRGRFANHIAPVIGHHPMVDVGRAEVEALVQSLDHKVQAGDMQWKTAVNIWTIVTKLFKDSTRSKLASLRVRAASPCSDVEGPDRGGEKAKVFLYPNEFLQLVECDDVPLRWRRLVVLAAYLGVRAGELEAIEWEDFDLPHGKVTVHRSIERKRGETKATKSETPRTFTVEQTLLPLLKAMHADAGGRGRVVRMPRHRDLAEKLRDWLRVAKVDRAELFTSDATRINLRWHDLRASHVTWSAVRGDSPALIMTRVGHEDWETLKKYLRQAEALVEGFGDVFPELPECLLGPQSSRAIVPANRPNRAKCMKSLRGGRDSNPRPPA